MQYGTRYPRVEMRKDTAPDIVRRNLGQTAATHEMDSGRSGYGTPQQTAENGDIVAAVIDDSVTLKRFYKEKNYFRLQPENDAMEPILTKDVSIVGIMKGLFRVY